MANLPWKMAGGCCNHPGRISWMNLPWFCICHAFSRSALNAEKQSTDGCVVRVEAPQYPSEFHDIFMGFTSIDRLDLTGFVGPHLTLRHSHWQIQRKKNVTSLWISVFRSGGIGRALLDSTKRCLFPKKNVLVFSVITFVFGMCVLNHEGWSAEVA